MSVACKTSVFAACVLAMLSPAACSVEDEPGATAPVDASFDSLPAEPESGFDEASDTSEVDVAQDLDAGLGIGNPCTSDNDCATGICILNYPGGYCTIRDCVVATGAGCPSGTVCRGRGGVMSTICFARCPLDQPCRTGYRCCDLDAAMGNYCVPGNSTACY